MKKVIAICLAIIVCFCFIACNTEKYEQYKSLIVDTATDGFGTKVEMDAWSGEYFDNGSKEEKTCHVQGTEYVGIYKKSIVEKWNSYTTDVYDTEDHIEFGLRHDTGELTYINLMNADFFDTEPYLPEKIQAEEQAYSLAKKIANDFIDDLENYEQITEEPRTTYKTKNGISYKITYYVTTFAKRISGCLSSDYISVKVTSKGNLASIIMGDIGAFDNDLMDFDISKVKQSITEKVSTIYNESKLKLENVKYSYQRLVMTPDGEVGIYSDITTTGTDDLEKATETRMCIFTFLYEK